MAEPVPTYGTLYADRTPLLLSSQEAIGAPEVAALDSGTDLLAAPTRAADILDHFFEGIYDLSAESHLSRLLKVILGDAGVGIIKKRYINVRFQETILTTHFLDMDRLYGDIFGLPRLSTEALDLSPYYDVGTPEEWEALRLRDAAYRARIEAFSRAIPLAGTPNGMMALASAILGCDCRVYETYALVDELGGLYGDPPDSGARSYAQVEADYADYLAMEADTYGEIQGGVGSFGRTTSTNRSEFILRPLRDITLEERMHLIRVLNRLRPAEALLTIDPGGIALHKAVSFRGVAADSTFWRIETKVLPAPGKSSAYTRYSEGEALAQPVPVFAEYQGEVWSYNGDVKEITSTVEDEHGHVIFERNYDRVVSPAGDVTDYLPTLSLQDLGSVLLGRLVSDGILVSNPYLGERLGAAL